MKAPRWIWFAGAAASLAAGGAWVYGKRTRERIPSPEGIDDPAIAAAFNRIARRSQLSGWQVTAGPLWLTIEGRKP